MDISSSFSQTILNKHDDVHISLFVFSRVVLDDLRPGIDIGFLEINALGQMSSLEEEPRM